MQPKYIRISELASTPTRLGRLPVSGATVWRWVKLGIFPSPVSLGPGTTAWSVESIEQWEATHSVAGAEPAAPAPTRSLPKREAPVLPPAASAELPPPKRGRGRPRKILPAAAAA